MADASEEICKLSIDMFNIHASAGKIAMQYNIKSGIRDFFIDNKKDFSEILDNLVKAEKLALKKGFAIAIGHPGIKTLQALSVFIADKDKNLIGKKVKLRSPLYCKAQDGICETCLNPVYVKRLQLKPGVKIGLIVATSIGADALVNLTLKKSHVGISLDLEEVNLEEDIFRYAE